MTIQVNATPHHDALEAGEVYGFGANWKRYLELIDDGRVRRAEESLRGMLGRDHFRGATWLDIGSGSGLFSLAARRLGAEVTSFDYDPTSVWCTRELKRRHYPDDPGWTVHEGSVLDPAFMARLPSVDIVYSWGVLHHTGRMYDAIRNAAGKVKPGGLFFLALYRKTIFCELWKIEKRLYCAGPEALRAGLRRAWVAKTRHACRLKGRDFDTMVAHYTASTLRGMDYERDVDDWLGGYPYESLTPPECRDFMGGLGFTLVNERAVTQGVSYSLSNGCDEWVFRREG
jgi:2-polyprenyl-6-hydroxyphenyl methylase/3-demethylubiquinone-9 3-methyltransferase